MPSVTVVTRVAHPVERVFAYVADATNDPAWAPFVTSVELVAGQGPGVGTVWRIGQREATGVSWNELTMTAHEPPTHLAWSMTTDDYDYVSIMDFTGDSATTSIRQTNTLTFGRPLAGRLWQATAQLALRRQFVLLRRALGA